MLKRNIILSTDSYRRDDNPGQTSLLEVVYDNGRMLRNMSLDEIRRNAKVTLPEMKMAA